MGWEWLLHCRVISNEEHIRNEMGYTTYYVTGEQVYHDRQVGQRLHTSSGLAASQPAPVKEELATPIQLMRYLFLA